MKKSDQDEQAKKKAQQKGKQKGKKVSGKKDSAKQPEIKVIEGKSGKPNPPKKNITKKDPNVELQPWLDYSKQTKGKRTNKNKKKNVGPELKNLKKQRRHAVITKLGILLVVSLIIVGGLTYYLSPVSLTQKITVLNNGDIPVEKVIKSSGLQTKKHILAQFLNKGAAEQKLKKAYPSIKSVKITMTDPTTLEMKLSQNKVIAYLKNETSYQKILDNGDVSKEKLVQAQLESLPIFLGYQKGKDLTEDIRVFQSLPSDIKEAVQFINQKAAVNTQIILVMKNQNVIIGDTDSLKDKISYYRTIQKQLTQPSIVDFEIGAFSRPLTETDKKSYLQ